MWNCCSNSSLFCTFIRHSMVWHMFLNFVRIRCSIRICLKCLLSSPPRVCVCHAICAVIFATSLLLLSCVWPLEPLQIALRTIRTWISMDEEWADEAQWMNATKSKETIMCAIESLRTRKRMENRKMHYRAAAQRQLRMRERQQVEGTTMHRSVQFGSSSNDRECFHFFRLRVVVLSMEQNGAKRLGGQNSSTTFSPFGTFSIQLNSIVRLLLQQRVVTLTRSFCPFSSCYFVSFFCYCSGRLCVMCMCVCVQGYMSREHSN